MNNKIICIGSGSSGNCYAVYDSRGRFVLLDCGLPYEVIMQAIDYDIANLSGIFVTHNHVGDHSKSVKKFIEKCVPCYGNEDLCESWIGMIQIEKAVNIDGFKIQTFELVHNIPNNAFIIDTYDGIRILYCTDTKYIPKVVRNVNYAIIEANYSDDIVLDRMLEGDKSESRFEWHQSIDDCIDYLKKIYYPKLRGVILTHLSDGNSNETEFGLKAQQELGFYNIVCAEKGVEMEIGQTDF